MNAGKTLTQLASEVERQLSSRHDYVAPVAKLEMISYADSVEEAVSQVPTPTRLKVDGVDSFGITDLGHDQIYDYTRQVAGVKNQGFKGYYDVLRREAPALLAQNVNHWLHKGNGDKRMVRTLDGRVRAFLSDRYRALDNYDLANVAITELQERGARVVSAELTERRMYIKAILPSLEADVKGSRKVGDIVQAMLTISNSEVGSGALKIEPGVYRLICLNGAIAPIAMKRYHVGATAALDEEVRAVLADETRQADDKAFWLKVRDVVRAAWDRDVFQAQVDKLSEATEQRIETDDISSVVEVVSRRFGLTDRTGKSILRHLVDDGEGTTRFGLAQAITATANDEKDYDLATDLQRFGSQVIDLPAKDWRLISEGREPKTGREVVGLAA